MHLYLSAVGFDEAAGDGEAEAGTGVVVFRRASAGFFASEGAVEDAGQVFGGDAFPGVGDFDAHRRAAGRCAQGYRAVGWGVAQSVRDEVVEDSLEAGRVHQDRVHVFGYFSY